MSKDEADDFSGEDPAVLLSQARAKAGKLLEQLISEQAQIERQPPKISPEALAEGMAAMANAIAAARRTVKALDAAIATAPQGPGDDPAAHPLE